MKTLDLVSKKKKKFSQKEASEIHFKERFFQRVGFILTDEKYLQLKNSIVSKGKFLHDARNGGCYRIEFEGLKLRVIYNPFKDILITVLS